MAHRRAVLIFDALVLVVGIAALAVVIYQLGWAGLRKVGSVGVWFGVIAAIDVVSMMCDAVGLAGFARCGGAHPRYWRVFAAQASGLAINRLTPANSLGEPVKVSMLARVVSTDTAIATVVLYNVATAFFGIAAISVGVPLTALMLDLPHQVAVVAWVGLAVLAAFAVTVAVLLRRGAAATLIGALRGMRLISAARSAAWTARVAPIDATLRQLGAADRSGLRMGVLGVVASRLFNWAGTIAVIHACDIPLTPPLVVAMLSVGILVSWISNVVPLGLGIADGTNYALYGVLGASPAASLVFTMVNRMRTVVIALLGLTVMAVASRVFDVKS